MCKKPTKQQCSLRNTSCLGILGSNDGNTHTQYAQMIRSWLMRQLFNEYETATNITGWWFEPSWKIWVRQWEGLSHTLWKIEHVWNHQSDKGSFPLPNHTQTEGTWPAAWKKNHPTEPPPGSSRQQSQNLSVSPVELLWPGSTFSKPFWTAAMGQKWSKDVKRFNTEICKNDAWFFSKFELVKFVRDAPNFEQLWKTGQPSRHMLTVAGPRNPLLNSTQGESGGWMFITSIHMYIYIYYVAF